LIKKMARISITKRRMKKKDKKMWKLEPTGSP
jgi:hypothetical protein